MTITLEEKLDLMLHLDPALLETGQSFVAQVRTTGAILTFTKAEWVDEEYLIADWVTVNAHGTESFVVRTFTFNKNELAWVGVR